MYHGTSSAAAAGILRQGFQPSKGGMLGPGIYCSAQLDKAGPDHPPSSHQATRYPLNHPEGDKVVLRLLVYTGRVYRSLS
jgi:hypothetical protein